MTKRPNSITLGDEGVKIILFRTRPGREKNFVGNLKSHLDRIMEEKNANIIEYSFFKILGLYDVMLMYRCKQFYDDLLVKGTFQDIIHSNEILCFPLFKEKGQEFILEKSLKPGLVISLLKLRTEVLLELGLDIEAAVVKYMESTSGVFVLGGLGWSEFLFIYSHSFQQTELDNIFLDLLCTASRFYYGPNERDEFIPLVHKTYSLLAVNYNVINKLVKTFPCGFDDSKGDPCPRLLISSTGPDFDLVQNGIPYFFRKSPRCFEYDPPRLMTGIHDLCISFKKGTWGRFLKSIIDFRKRYSESLLDTRIEVRAPARREQSPESEKIEKSMKKLEFPDFFLGENETRLIYERPGTSHIIATLYRFCNFFQNPLFRDSFLDLYHPANELVNKVIGKNNSGTWKVDDRKLNEFLRQFQWALRERAMGAYLFTEEDEHLFSPLKGGVQKILLALASIPFSLLKTLMDDPWRGYVSIGLKYEPMHFYENLFVPFDHALYPEKHWWCLIHEIGHIVVLKWKMLSLDHGIVNQVIQRLPESIPAGENTEFLDLADNCFADLFDFLVGFLRKRSLYLNTCWKFLIRHSLGQEHSKKHLKQHLVRHFVGWVYEKRFLAEKKSLTTLDDNQAIEEEAKEFIDELKKISEVNEMMTNYGFDSKNFPMQLYAESVDCINLLDHFSRFMAPVIELLKKLERVYDSDNFNNEVISCMQRGEIVDPTLIEFPHLIPLRLMEEAAKKGEDAVISFKTRLAIILSLYWYSFANFVPSIIDQQDI